MDRLVGMLGGKQTDGIKLSQDLLCGVRGAFDVLRLRRELRYGKMPVFEDLLSILSDV